jgi:hypothetical protein
LRINERATALQEGDETSRDTEKNQIYRKIFLLIDFIFDVCYKKFHLQEAFALKSKWRFSGLAISFCITSKYKFLNARALNTVQTYFGGSLYITPGQRVWK